MVPRWIDSFFCQQFFQFTVSAFSCMIWGMYIIENSNVSQWLVPVSLIQNHSAITQLFYVTSSSLKLLVHNLLHSKMLQELLLHQAEKSKNFPCGSASPPMSQHLPTSLLSNHIQGLKSHNVMGCIGTHVVIPLQRTWNWVSNPVLPVSLSLCFSFSMALTSPEAGIWVSPQMRDSRTASWMNTYCSWLGHRGKE